MDVQEKAAWHTYVRPIPSTEAEDSNDLKDEKIRCSMLHNHTIMAQSACI